MISVNLLRDAYVNGLFPMADGDGRDSVIRWYLPEERAVFMPESFHVPRRLGRFLRRIKKSGFWDNRANLATDDRIDIRWNDNFPAVMAACNEDRDDGHWINPELIESYTAWHKEGEAHCLSIWQGDVRIGGIYGVLLGHVFMAESMFSRRSNASSVALVVLMAGLAKAGVKYVDVQFTNPHLQQFHPQELTCEDYLEKLHAGLKGDGLDDAAQKQSVLRADYFSLDEAVSFVQSLSQTS